MKNLIDRRLYTSTKSTVYEWSLNNNCPGWVAQLVSALCPYPKAEGSIPGQSTYKSQPMNA